MKPKQASAEWYIAATHWLTAGFAIPFIISFIVGIILGVTYGIDGVIPYLNVLLSIVSIVSIWLGVMYSSKFLDKTYVIKDSSRIVLLSTVYLAVLGYSFRALQFLQGELGEYDLIAFTLVVVTFFVASKKYIKNNITPTEIPVA